MVAFLRYLKRTQILLKFFIAVLLALFYCEYLHYYLTIVTCQWPTLAPATTGAQQPLRAMVLADTHLLGRRNGHWFDKLRREWQMHRAFQTAVFLHSPDVVIFLGDLFDEGKWSSSTEFAGYVRRFSDLFSVPNTTRVIVVPGNHDMGFHYSITPSLASRFDKAFGIASVSVTEVAGVAFVAVNSMALHGDDCFLCRPARQKLVNISRGLQCLQGGEPCTAPFVSPVHGGVVRPVLLQHYPLYRPSDAHCSDSDAAPEEMRRVRFRERWECLSREASEELLSLLQPRLVLSGHTHHGCTTIHRHPPGQPSPAVQEDNNPAEDDSLLSPEDAEYAAEEHQYQEQQRHAAAHQYSRGNTEQEPLTIPEITIASFSWRNKKRPTFAMVTLSSEQHAVYRCEMPREQTVVLMYCCAAVLFLVSLARRKLFWLAALCRHGAQDTDR